MKKWFERMKSKFMLYMILRKVKSRLKKSGLEKNEVREISKKVRESLS